MASVDYITEKLIAGEIITDQVALAADTYYKGMLLTYVAADDNYAYDATPADGDTIAIYLGDGSVVGRVLAAPGYDSVIIGGEVFEGGIVTDANAAFTVTEDIRAICNAAGIYIKRK